MSSSSRQLLAVHGGGVSVMGVYVSPFPLRMMSIRAAHGADETLLLDLMPLLAHK